MIYFSVYKWRNHESHAPPPPFNVSRLQKSEAEQRADLCSRLQAFGKRNESKTKIRGKRGFKFRKRNRGQASARGLKLLETRTKANRNTRKTRLQNFRKRNRGTRKTRLQIQEAEQR